MSEEQETIDAQLQAAVGAGAREADEVVSALTGLPEKDVRGALDRLVREQGAAAVPLLERAASGAKGGLVVAAVRSLGMVRDPAAASALRRLGDTLQGDARKAARRELHRLVSLGVGPAPVEAAPGETRGPTWPIYKALASIIDGDGNRAVWIAFDRGAEVDLLILLMNEEKGIVDADVREGMARSRFDRHGRDLLEDEEMPWVEMPPDDVRYLVEEAHGKNAASGTALPLEYLAWWERLGRPEKPYEQPPVYGVINAAEVRWDPRYLDNSDKLYQLPAFQSWAIPAEELAEFVRERETAQRSGLVLSGMSEEMRERTVEDRAIQALFGVRRRASLKRRLEEMAYLLWRRDQTYQARMALAAAMALEPPDRRLTDHPFVRAMVQSSLGLAEARSRGERRREVKPGVQLYLP